MWLELPWQGYRQCMQFSRIVSTTLGGLFVVGALSGAPSAAKADTTSTALIVAGVAAITGAILYDSSNHPYYVRNDRRYYITQNEERYYRSHHHGVVRRAYVPEQEYPVARDPYHGGYNGHGDNGNGYNQQH
jgi:hypothetical protein